MGRGIYLKILAKKKANVICREACYMGVNSRARICKFMIGPKYFIENRFDPPSFKFQLQFLDSRVKEVTMKLVDLSVELF